MAPLVGCSKVVPSHGSVNLGGGQINVAQQLLHGTQVGTAFEEVRCERVTECVWELRDAVHKSAEEESE